METQHETPVRTLPVHPGISPIDQGRIIRRIAKDHAMDEAHAAVVFDETIRFLELAARQPSKGFVPTEAEDKGWHTFLLYTKAYRAFCQSLGRTFLDHEPNDLPGQVRVRQAAKRPAGDCGANHCGSVSCDQECADAGQAHAKAAHCGINCKTSDATADCYPGCSCQAHDVAALSS